MTTATQTIRSPNTVPLPAARASPVLPIDEVTVDQEAPEEPTNLVNEPSIFEGTRVSFPNGSQWQIEKPMSYLKLQRIHVPCEARQVFIATCMGDVSKQHSIGDKAVIKIRFQVRASEETIDDYQDNIDEVVKELTQYPKNTEESQAYIARLQKGLRKCTQRTKKPNSDTLNEIAALRCLADRTCSSTPWLLDFVADILPSGVHRKAVEGGFIVFILMTKAPGMQLDAGFLQGMTPIERENLRNDFKDAVCEVWKCGLECQDMGLHNLKWDKEKRKCYIVDLEHSEFVSEEEQKSLEFEEKEEYESWGLSEDYYR